MCLSSTGIRSVFLSTSQRWTETGIEKKKKNLPLDLLNSFFKKPFTTSRVMMGRPCASTNESETERESDRRQ